MSVIPWKSSWWCATLATSSMLVPEFHPPGRFHGVSTQSTSSTLPLWDCAAVRVPPVIDSVTSELSECCGNDIISLFSFSVNVSLSCLLTSIGRGLLVLRNITSSSFCYLLFFLLSPLLAPLPLPGHLLEIVAMCFGPWSGLWLVQLGVVSLIWCSQW